MQFAALPPHLVCFFLPRYLWRTMKGRHFLCRFVAFFFTRLFFFYSTLFSFCRYLSPNSYIMNRGNSRDRFKSKGRFSLFGIYPLRTLLLWPPPLLFHPTSLFPVVRSFPSPNPLSTLRARDPRFSLSSFPPDLFSHFHYISPFFQAVFFVII